MNDLRDIKSYGHLKDILYDIEKEYNRLKKQGLPKLDKSLADIFYSTGSRQEYENVYFLRRGRLLTTFVMCLMYGSEYMNELTAVIEDICAECTWALPAHIDRDNEKPECVIDLFNAETAQALSEICEILNDEVPKNLYIKIKKEIDRRIITPFLENTFFWEKASHNWAAVCAGSVGMTFIYMFPEKFSFVSKRIEDAMESYLSGFGDDGITTEGMSYWNYGFRYFVNFAILYKERYGVDLMNNDKVREIAKCQQNMMLRNDIPISFSDGSRSVVYNSGLAHLLRGIYGEEIKIINSKYNGMDNCYRFTECIGTLKYIDEELCTISEEQSGEQYFKDARWYVNRKNSFAFAIKAGHNGEPHNHNDTGSFIIATDRGQIICDYGAGEYTKDYFSDKRYTYLCNSSRGHSVPIIDGKYQSAGKKFFGTVVKASNDIFEADIENAYEIGALKSLKRRFEISENSLRLCDTFEFSDDNVHSITERFVSVIKPKLTDNGVEIGDILIKSKKTPVISSQRLMSHNAEEETLFFTDYNSDNKFEIEFLKI